MFFLRRKKSSKASLLSTSSETVQETMQRRANEYIATLQHHYPREFAKLLSEVEQGDLARARLTLQRIQEQCVSGHAVSTTKTNPPIGIMNNRGNAS